MEIKKEYWKGGNLKSEVNLKDGSPDGLMVTWFENGDKESEQNFKNGQLDGISTWWVLVDTSFTDSEGKFHAYDLISCRVMVASYKNGKLDGKCTKWYHSSGSARILSEEHFKNGERDGTVTKWSFRGEKEYEKTYVKGKISNEKSLSDGEGGQKDDLAFGDDEMIKAMALKDKLWAEQKHILDPQPTKSIPLWISVPVVVAVFFGFMKFFS